MGNANKNSDHSLLNINSLYSGKFMRDSNLIDVIDYEVNKLANEVFFFAKFNTNKEVYLQVSKNDYTFTEKLFDEEMTNFVGYAKFVFIKDHNESLEKETNLNDKRMSIGLTVPPMENLNKNYSGVSHSKLFYNLWGCNDFNECIYLIELYRKHKARFKNMTFDKLSDVNTIDIRKMFYNTVQLNSKEPSKRYVEKFARIRNYLEEVIPEIFYLGANIK